MAMDDKSQKTAPTQQHIPQAGNPPIGTVTSSFFVSMDKIFAVSNVGAGESAGKANVEDAVQLLWFTSVEERPSQGNMASDFQASATLVHSLLEMHVQTDSGMPILRQNMRNNTPIKKIKITRVGHLGEGKDNTEMYSTTFTNCFLEVIEEFPDKLVVKARINTRSDTAAATKYDAVQGTTSGSTASGWDYAQNAPMA